MENRVEEHKKRAAESVDGLASKRKKSKLAEYVNSWLFSDVTIHYGASGERRFEGHKVILSANSRWFKAAFTSGFNETESKSIRLHDDNPDAVTAMLNFAYDRNNFEQETSSPSVANTILCIELYRVADKYDMPKLRAMLPTTFQKKLQYWCRDSDWRLSNTGLSPEGFCEIISRLYTLPNAYRSHEMVQALMELIDRSHQLRIFENDGRQAPLLMHTVKEVAQFGRDLFLYLMEETRAEFKTLGVHNSSGEPDIRHNAIELSVSVQVTCRFCCDTWRRTIPRREDYSNKGRCIICGEYEEDWRECEVWNKD